MGTAERASRLALAGLASSLLVLGACDSPPAGERSGTLQISGPVGTEYSVHPRFEAEGRTIVEGCCSFAAADSSVRRLEGDVDGREVSGPGYRAIISFGNGLARAAATPGPAPTVSQLDGVKLEKRVVEKGESSEPHFHYRAIVPLDARAKARNVREPGLEITGWCDRPSACAKLAAILDSVRF
ncbi:MAG TPA: hypothetical protein VF620_10810 [Allosphingosinicella sp.]|jgi:hypothetical protein